MSLSNFAGSFDALAFAYGSSAPGAPEGLRVKVGTTATGAGTLTLDFGFITLADGTVVNVLATNASITTGTSAGSNNETVTPSAVSNATPQVYGSPTVTATYTYTHGVGELISSGTIGLMEALNYVASIGGGRVIITPQWAQAGGTDAMVDAANAALPANAVLIDERNGGGGAAAAYFALTNAQTLALNSAPVALLPAPGAGLAYDVLDCVFFNDFATAAFASGGAIQLSFGTGTTIPATATVAATFLTSPVADQMIKVAGALATNLASDILNKALYVAAATADFTTGAGVLRGNIAYRVVKFA